LEDWQQNHPNEDVGQLIYIQTEEPAETEWTIYKQKQYVPCWYRQVVNDVVTEQVVNNVVTEQVVNNVVTEQVVNNVVTEQVVNNVVTEQVVNNVVTEQVVNNVVTALLQLYKGKLLFTQGNLVSVQ
jgi:hypothetical protein